MMSPPKNKKTAAFPLRTKVRDVTFTPPLFLLFVPLIDVVRVSFERGCKIPFLWEDEVEPSRLRFRSMKEGRFPDWREIADLAYSTLVYSLMFYL
ncbi:hypothetical protein CDAR_3721 [Caerostris darwini]|uniref:Uncharacterized protein n=1 Tax=Caerostris darwini TaxID=1538125 RepID=A0AAV4PBM6_9ARAC|nr:hypothetical protein CDAR_3721 [Caerostris darwini]